MRAKNTFTVGQKVSLERWDKSTHPKNRMGVSVVKKLEENIRGCESGVMVTVESENGIQRLDSNWLLPIERDLFT